MKKRFLLALLLIPLLILCSCNSGRYRFDPEDYMIVYAAADGEAVTDAAFALAAALGMPDTAVVSDAAYTIADSDAKEIIIGNTNRPLSAKYSHSSDILNLDYIIKFEENNLVLFGGCADATVNAVNYFIDNFILNGNPRFNDHSYHHEYEIKSIIVDNVSVSCFKAVSPDGEYRHLIEHISETLTKKSGLRSTDHTHVLNIFINSDTTLPSNQFAIKVRNSDIMISGANSYALNEAISYFLNEIIVPQTKLTSNQDFTGSISKKPLAYQSFIASRSGLDNTYKKLTQDKSLNIVYFGSSISSGYGASEADKSWTGLTTAWFKSTFPNAEINAYTSAISASGSMLGAFRCAHDVLSLKPDLVFLEFSVNDSYSGLEDDQITTYYESIIRQIKEFNPDCDIISLYPADQNNARQNSGGSSHQAVLHEELAKLYDIPSLNIGSGLCSVFDFNDDTEWNKYFADIVHPNDNGHQVYYDILKEFFEAQLIYDTRAKGNEFVMPEKLSKQDFNPRFITADKLDIDENRNWEYVADSYWSVANPYPGYLTPVDSGNYLEIEFEGGNHAALFAQYSTSNRLVYTIDYNTQRVSSQSVNQPLMLFPAFRSEYDAEDNEYTEHSISMSINFTDMSTPFILTGLLIW